MATVVVKREKEIKHSKKMWVWVERKRAWAWSDEEEEEEIFCK